MITSIVTVSGKDRHNSSVRKFLADFVHHMHPSARTLAEQLEQSLGKRQNGIIETSLHTFFCTYYLVIFFLPRMVIFSGQVYLLAPKFF